MPERTLRFKITQDGLVEETVEGVLGQSCHQLTENLEEALGSVQHSEPTSESFLQAQENPQTISAEVL
tara:strand:+ start:1011 stop:1214 length:204 start_codon:yes stop_codon:yes gene_type:complete